MCLTAVNEKFQMVLLLAILCSSAKVDIKNCLNLTLKDTGKCWAAIAIEKKSNWYTVTYCSLDNSLRGYCACMQIMVSSTVYS